MTGNLENFCELNKASNKDSRGARHGRWHDLAGTHRLNPKSHESNHESPKMEEINMGFSLQNSKGTKGEPEMAVGDQYASARIQALFSSPPKIFLSILSNLWTHAWNIKYTLKNKLITQFD